MIGYYSNMHGMWLDVLHCGAFSTTIGKWKEDRYYMLSLDTTPRCQQINTDRRFLTLTKAEEYYLKQLKKVLIETLKEIDNEK